MIRVCMTCDQIFGEKEPLEDKSETHGLCPVCYPIEMARLKEEMKRLENPPSPPFFKVG